MTRGPHIHPAMKTKVRWVLLGALLAVTVGSAPQLQAAPPKFNSVLDWAPADTAFFTSTLRLKEQWEIVTASKAWAKFTALPYVQQAWMSVQTVMAFQPAFGQPENQDLMAMLGDLFSHEVAFYCDQHTIDALSLSMQITNAVNEMEAKIAEDGVLKESIMVLAGRAALKVLDANIDKLETPTIVLACKHSNAERIKAQLKRLEELLEPALADNPLKGRFQRSKVGPSEFLTFTLDGKMIPWEEIPLDKIEEQPGQFDKVVAKIKNLKLVISLGLRDDYLLLTITPSTDKIAAMGTGPRLVERPEFESIARFADKRLTGLGFTAKEASGALESYQIENMHHSLRTAFEVFPHLSRESKKGLQHDLDELFTDLKSLQSPPGDVVSASVLTERGYDCYSYDFGQKPRLDGSQPLSLLEHLGGSPLLAVVGRSKQSNKEYPLLVKWLKLGHHHFEELALPQMSNEDQAKYKEWMEFANPLLARLDTATSTMLLPALADGQTGLVLDAKITSPRWFKGMPPGEAPLPMLEPALIFGVSNAELLKKAVAEYRAVGDELLKKIREQNPEAIPPEFKIPEPQVRETRAGTVFSYHFPQAWEVDAQLAPCMGLNPHVAVVSTVPKYTAELLTKTPFDGEGPAAETQRPMASAVYFDWAGLVEAATPWVDYGMRRAAEASNNGGGAEDLKGTLSQVHGTLEVLKVLRTVSSSTYVEGRSMVTHTEVHIKDLP